MKLRWQREGDDLRVTITGPLRWMQGGADPLTALRAEILTFTRTPNGRVFVDLSAVHQADPRSVFALLEALQPVRESGRITFQGRGSAIAAMVAGGQIPWFEPIEAAPGEDVAAAGASDPWGEMVQAIPERAPERQDIWGSAAKKIEAMLAACDAEREEDDSPRTSPSAGRDAPARPAAPSARGGRERQSGSRPTPVAPPKPSGDRPSGGRDTPSRPAGSRDTVLRPGDRKTKSPSRPLTRRETREQEEERQRAAEPPPTPAANVVWFDEGLADPLGDGTPPQGFAPGAGTAEGSPGAPAGGLAAPPRSVPRPVPGVSPIDATPPAGQDVFEWFFEFGEQSVRQGSEGKRKTGEVPAPDATPRPSGAARAEPAAAPPTPARPPAAKLPAKPLAKPSAGASSPVGKDPLGGRPSYQVIPAAKLPARQPPATPPPAAPPPPPPPRPTPPRPPMTGLSSETIFVDLSSKDFTDSAMFESARGFPDESEFSGTPKPRGTFPPVRPGAKDAPLPPFGEHRPGSAVVPGVVLPGSKTHAPSLGGGTKPASPPARAPAPPPARSPAAPVARAPAAPAVPAAPKSPVAPPAQKAPTAPGAFAVPRTPAAPAAPSAPQGGGSMAMGPPRPPPHLGWNAENLFAEFEARMAQRAGAAEEESLLDAVADSVADTAGDDSGEHDEIDTDGIIAGAMAEAFPAPAFPVPEVAASAGRPPAPTFTPPAAAVEDEAPAADSADAEHDPVAADDADASDISDEGDDDTDESQVVSEDFVIDQELEHLYLSHSPSARDLIDEEREIRSEEEWKPLGPANPVAPAAPTAPVTGSAEQLRRAQEEAVRRRLAQSEPPAGGSLALPRAAPPAPPPPAPAGLTPIWPPERAAQAPRAPLAPPPSPPAPPAEPSAAVAGLPPQGSVRVRSARAPIAHAAHGAPETPAAAMPTAPAAPRAAPSPIGAPAAPPPSDEPGSYGIRPTLVPASPPAAPPAPPARTAPPSTAMPRAAPSSRVQRGPLAPISPPVPSAAPPRAAETAADESAPRPAPRSEARPRSVAKKLGAEGETDRARAELEATCRRLLEERDAKERELATLRRAVEELRGRAPGAAPAAAPKEKESAPPGWIAALAVPPVDPAPARARYGATLSRFRESGKVDPQQVLIAIDELSRSAGGIAAAIGGYLERGEQNPGDGWRALLLVVSTLVREGADFERRRRAIRLAWLASLVRCAPGSDGDPVAVGPGVARLLGGPKFRFPGEVAAPIDTREADHDLALWRACARLDERRHLTTKRWRQSVGRTLAAYEGDRAVRAGLARLIGMHSLYFPGTWVELSSGGIGPVIGGIPGRPELPRVLVLFRRNGRRGSRTPPQLFPEGDGSGVAVVRVLSRPHVAEEDGNSLASDSGGSSFLPKK